MTLLELQRVEKRYGGRAALAGVDLTLEEGASLGLLGPNGAGKTTLLRILLGLSYASGGRVRLQGRGPEDPAARIGVGFLPERLALPAHMKLRGFLRLHAALAGVSDADVAADVVRVAEQVGVAERLDHRLGDLSKGLAQRVGFAQAFLGAPRLLVLDEPITGLDPIGIREARDWIAGARARGCAVLVSSHQLSEVERVCDRVAVLHEGRLVAQGPMQEVVRDGESLEDAFVRLVSRGGSAAMGAGG